MLASSGISDAAQSAVGGRTANPSLARLFTLLTHEVENGTPRPHLVRYEQPVRIALEGDRSSRYHRFVEDYAGRLRRNSGIDIAVDSRNANLHVRFVEREFAAVAPNVSCLVAPGNVDWRQLAAQPHRYGVRATAHATAIAHMTVFIPSAASERRTRSCLLEEIAQALGPANDLYGVGDTIFNDDDAHMWPTDFDYLMLRVLYDPELRTGMNRAESERAALRVLERVNPSGVRAPAVAAVDDARMGEWQALVRRAGDPRTDGRTAAELARQALALAEGSAPGSSYHCHSLIMLGKLLNARAPHRAMDRFDDAASVCRQAHGQDDIRLAWIAQHRSTVLRQLDRYEEARQGASGGVGVLQSLSFTRAATTVERSRRFRESGVDR